MFIITKIYILAISTGYKNAATESAIADSLVGEFGLYWNECLIGYIYGALTKKLHSNDHFDIGLDVVAVQCSMATDQSTVELLVTLSISSIDQETGEIDPLILEYLHHEVIVNLAGKFISDSMLVSLSFHFLIFVSFLSI